MGREEEHIQVNGEKTTRNHYENKDIGEWIILRRNLKRKRMGQCV
jgi:hypothetical protein